jgi:hypothetical protein
LIGMIRRLTGLLGRAVEQSLQAVMLRLIVAMSIALFAAISLGFGTFAAYGCLRGLLGGSVAALIICFAYGLAAVTIWVVWTARGRQARPAQRGAAPAAPVAPAPVASVTSLLQSLAETAAPQDREVMAAAARLGRELSPFQLIALAVIGGFIVGRKLDR